MLIKTLLNDAYPVKVFVFVKILEILLFLKQILWYNFLKVNFNSVNKNSTQGGRKWFQDQTLSKSGS